MKEPNFPEEYEYTEEDKVYAAVKDYYELMSKAADTEKITFIGHFDIISKYNVYCYSIIITFCYY